MPLATEIVGRAEVEYVVNFDKLNRSLKDVEQRTRGTARKSAKSFDIFGRAVDGAAGRFRTAARANRGFQASLQNVGFQMQDVVVSLEAGQDPLRVLVQQGTQLISVLGPIATLAAAGGAAVVVIAKALYDAASAAGAADAAMREFEATQERLNKLMEAGSRNVEEFIENFRQMTNSVREFAREQIEDQVQQLTTAIRSQRQELVGLADDLEEARRVERATRSGIGRLAIDQLFPPELLAQLQELNVGLKQGAITIAEYGTEVSNLRQAFPDAPDAFSDFATSVSEVVTQNIESNRELETANERLRISAELAVEAGANWDAFGREVGETAKTLFEATSALASMSAEEQRLMAATDEAVAFGAALRELVTIPADEVRAERRAAALAKQAEAARKAGEAFGRLTIETAKYRAEGARFEESLDRVRELADARRELAESQAAEIRRQGEIAEDSLERFKATGQSVAVAVGSAFSDTLRAAARDVESLDQALADTLLRLADAVAQILIFQPFTQALATGIGSLFSPAQSITSGPLSSPGQNLLVNRAALNAAEPFAAGGIVTQPTIGLLAENRRPEAVIPLDRLGDVAGDGGTIVNVYSPDVPVQTQRRPGPDGRDQIDVIVGGSLGRLQQRGVLPGITGARRELR